MGRTLLMLLTKRTPFNGWENDILTTNEKHSQNLANIPELNRETHEAAEETYRRVTTLLNSHISLNIYMIYSHISHIVLYVCALAPMLSWRLLLLRKKLPSRCPIQRM